MSKNVSRPFKRPRRNDTSTAAPEGASKPTKPGQRQRHFAIVGAGMAGIACARTLVQAGHRVTVFEQAASAGGRTATVDTVFGSFDTGAQYFTVRDPRFARAIDTVPGLCKPWSANNVRVLDATGRVTSQGLLSREAHWVASPGMQSLVAAWAQPLVQAGQVQFNAKVQRIERDTLNPQGWQLRTEGPDGSQHVYAGFDAVLQSQPATASQALLVKSALDCALTGPLSKVAMAPCWTLTLAYPQAVRPGLTTLGPQWNVARSTHHRIAWLARESSKPGRGSVERWTVQANPAWSAEHLQDDEARVQAKLLKAFGEVTGLRAEPAHVELHCWPYAQTTHPLGKSHLWDARMGLGACGDWCLGHRLEDAFVSGLELALAVK